MKRNPISKYMTPTPQTIGKTQPLAVAHRLMREMGIRHLPVLDRGELVGIVSERDLHFIETLRDVDPEEVLVEEAMTPDPYRVTPGTSLDKVVRQMSREKYGAALVVEDGRVVGVFTTIDALRVLASVFAEQRPAAAAGRRRAA